MEKTAALYGSSFSSVFKAITSDNGAEFAQLSKAVPGVDVYYADPYSSYQRGTNEKQNSLIRRFIPKGRSFDNIFDESVAAIEDWINHLSQEKSSIIAPLLIFFKVSYLILQFKHTKN